MSDYAIIETDDGYTKELPYRPEMEDWKVGMMVEVYHEEERWFCEYRITNIHWLSDPTGLEKRYRFFINRTQKKRWWKNPHDEQMDDLTSKWAKDIADEIDKKILDDLIKISKQLK